MMRTMQTTMMMLSQAHAPTGGALSANGVSLSSSTKFTRSLPSSTSSSSSSSSLFAHRRPKFLSRTDRNKSKRFPTPLTLANADGAGSGATPSTNSSPPPPSVGTTGDTAVSFVGEESVPLEGVIQFEKPNSSTLFDKWGRVALLSGGDVLALVLFSAIGRFSHGFSVFDTETLRTADPFIAGWFLSAYFLGGFGEDGRGMNGRSKAIIAAAKSWCLGIPLGLVIRAVTVGHIPQPNFILVTLGSTALLLIGWRTLLFSIFLKDDNEKKNDVYRRGSPFELFEYWLNLATNLAMDCDVEGL